MRGLFSEIQGCFKNTYSGRYLAYLLAEFFRQNSEMFSKVLRKFGLRYSHKTLDQINPNGWYFPGKKQTRIADLAILDSKQDPRVLVEIKDADAGKKENAAQIGDYLKYIKKHKGVEFLFLSRHIPQKEEGRALETGNKHVNQKLFKDLYKALTGRDPFSQMLREYLEDIHVAYHEPPDLKTLEYITLQLLGLHGSRVTEKSVPEFFDTIFDDLAVISQWVQGANIGLFKTGLRRRFYISPSHDVQRLEADIAGNDSKKAQKIRKKLKEEQDLSEYCNGGQVNFCVEGNLTSKSTQLFLEFGICIGAEKKQKKKEISYGCIYANIKWKPWRESDSSEDCDYLSKFPDEKTFQEKLRKVLKGAKTAAQKKCPKQEKQVLLKFQVP